MSTCCTSERIKSTHQVEVVPIELQPHPNADSLSIVPIFGYTCCARTADWQGVKLGAWVPPDSLVDVSRPEFAFLAPEAKADGKVRIKARKMRGVVSFGLLVPAPEGAKEGDDVAELLGVEHYEPELACESKKRMFMGGDVAKSPEVQCSKYDVDAFRRYHDRFKEGEPVVVTEKLDGSNSRYVYVHGEQHCGSRTEWKKEFSSYEHITAETLRAAGVLEEKITSIIEQLRDKPKKQSMWWEMFNCTPSLQNLCRDNPGLVVYGEIFGNVNRIKYGLPETNRFMAFDLMREGRFLNFCEAYELAHKYGLPWAPLLSGTWGVMSNREVTWSHRGWAIPYDFDTICTLAEGPTTVMGAKAGVLREGCVVRPLAERWDPHVGRVCFKAVSASFLEMK